MARSRFRSVRYDLDAAVEVARMTDSAGGSIGADVLAPALGYRGTNNGAYLSRVAAARLFGVVSGRGGQIELSERGRQILTGSEPAAGRARRDAFLAVPLFRAVADATGTGTAVGEVLPVDLDRWLVEAFGETEAKATPLAGLLVASAGQAGLLRRSADGTVLFTTDITDFTSVDNLPSHGRRLPVRWRKDRHPKTPREVAVAERGMWLDEETDQAPGRPPVWRRPGVAAAAAAVLIVVAVPVALVAGGSPAKPTAAHKPAPSPRIGNGPAEHEVLSALSATTDSGSFNFSYTISSTTASAPPPTTTTTTTCPSEDPPAATGAGGSSSTGYTVCFPPTAQSSPDVTGSGTIDTSPLAMIASADIGSGLDVSVRVDSSNVYEGASGDVGLAPDSSDGSDSGSNLPGFAGITESTLGSREGAVAMMGMASPTGYLDLVQPAVSAASQTGTGTVDGVAVTDYTVTNNLNQLAMAAGTSSAEAQTITTALGVLNAQGLKANTAVVGIDSAGFIRQVKSVDTFADGGTATLVATFSNFGCAGTVLMPGQSGSGTPPAGCSSPDTPKSAAEVPASVPTTTPATSTTTTTLSPEIHQTPPTTTPSGGQETTTTIVSTPGGPASSTTTTQSSGTPPGS